MSNGYSAKQYYSDGSIELTSMNSFTPATTTKQLDVAAAYSKTFRVKDDDISAHETNPWYIIIRSSQIAVGIFIAGCISDFYTMYVPSVYPNADALTSSIYRTTVQMFCFFILYPILTLDAPFSWVELLHKPVRAFCHSCTVEKPWNDVWTFTFLTTLTSAWYGAVMLGSWIGVRGVSYYWLNSNPDLVIHFAILDKLHAPVGWQMIMTALAVFSLIYSFCCGITLYETSRFRTIWDRSSPEGDASTAEKVDLLRAGSAYTLKRLAMAVIFFVYQSFFVSLTNRELPFIETIFSGEIVSGHQGDYGYGVAMGFLGFGLSLPALFIYLEFVYNRRLPLFFPRLKQL